ncbi:hypothetical protein J3R73_005927 [Labrys monachus]|uniref:Uncharacterized protein n=1 Tax=Labrys monachus TaxID=217067 RepID=A0ABU0FQ06_9HYPH|nr:hypothetical protein [Labrys monachus]
MPDGQTPGAPASRARPAGGTGSLAGAHAGGECAADRDGGRTGRPSHRQQVPRPARRGRHESRTASSGSFSTGIVSVIPGERSAGIHAVGWRPGPWVLCGRTMGEKAGITGRNDMRSKELASPDYSTQEVCKALAFASAKDNIEYRLIARHGQMIGRMISSHGVDGKTESGRLLNAMYPAEPQQRPRPAVVQIFTNRHDVLCVLRP